MYTHEPSLSGISGLCHEGEVTGLIQMPIEKPRRIVLLDAYAIVFLTDDGPGIQGHFDIWEEALQNLVDMLGPRRGESHREICYGRLAPPSATRDEKSRSRAAAVAGER